MGYLGEARGTAYAKITFAKHNPGNPRVHRKLIFRSQDRYVLADQDCELTLQSNQV